MELELYRELIAGDLAMDPGQHPSGVFAVNAVIPVLSTLDYFEGEAWPDSAGKLSAD